MLSTLCCWLVPLPQESNLAWSSDQNHLYGPVQAENYNVDPDFRGGATTTQPLNQAQHWMVGAGGPWAGSVGGVAWAPAG